MEYTVIDRTSWERKEYFEHYLSSVPCTYSFTTKLDISNLRKKQVPLYPTMLYLLTRTVNKYPEFRMAFRSDGQLVCYEDMHPSYTVFHKDTETFSNIWTEYSDDFHVFCENYALDLRNYGTCEGLFPKPDLPENSFTVSMVPWSSFDGFNLNTEIFDYLIPIFTMGKFYEDVGVTYLPFALQVHHAVCDGFHTCRFINDLQAQIEEF